MRKPLLATVLFVLLPLGANADPIQFVFSGTGSGSLDSTAFTNKSFTITAQGDTSTRTSIGIESPGSTGYYVVDSTANIQISGLGTIDFLSLSRTFINNTNLAVGFERPPGTGPQDLFDSRQNSIFSSWDMTTSFGPASVSTGGLLTQWDGANQPVITTGGTLVFNSGPSPMTFAATVVPEPSALTLALLALGAVGLLARRRY